MHRLPFCSDSLSYTDCKQTLIDDAKNRKKQFFFLWFCKWILEFFIDGLFGPIFAGVQKCCTSKFKPSNLCYSLVIVQFSETSPKMLKLLKHCTSIIRKMSIVDLKNQQCSKKQLYMKMIFMDLCQIYVRKACRFVKHSLEISSNNFEIQLKY